MLYFFIFTLASIENACGLNSREDLCRNKAYIKAIALLNLLDPYCDSKSYVDLEITTSLFEVEVDTEKILSLIPNSHLSYNLEDEDIKKEIKLFKEKHFKNTEKGLEEVEISPFYLIKRSCIDKMYNRIQDLWKDYYKKYSSLTDNPNDTFLRIKGHICVLGGRFNEMYYWDTYWIILGLLNSNLVEEAFSLIQSFVEIIKLVGFIPNGTRKYYLGRSQPPLFLFMLDLVLENTDNELIKEYILNEGLEAALVEYNWFMSERREKNFNVYRVISETPRLESYKEDSRTLLLHYDSNKALLDQDSNKALLDRDSNKTLLDQDSKELFSNLATGAESGWDFSSRWLKDGVNLHTIDILNIIPVDLNSIMLRNERILLKLAERKGLLELRDFFKKAIKRREKALRLLWNREEGVWNDINYSTGEFTDKRFYISNLYPLYWGRSSKKYSILHKYKKELFGYPGGIPVSGYGEDTSQQWDFPNVWAPCTQFFIEYLLKEKEDLLALHAAKSFYNSIKKEFLKTNLFFEKYNCLMEGKGSGGEYPLQNGFGWTNGTLIWMIKKFGAEIDKKFDHEKSYKKVEEYLQRKVINK